MPSLKFALLAGGAISGFGLTIPAALAQTSIAPGSNLATVGGTPTSSTSWVLGGAGIYLFSNLALQPGTPGLTLDGAGNTLTFNDGGGNFGHFTDSVTGAYTLNFANLTLTGGNQPLSGAQGGVLTVGATFNAPLTLNVLGTVSFSGNSAYSGGTSVTIDGSDITLSGNGSKNGSLGGAISANNAIIIGNAASKVVIDGNYQGDSLDGNSSGFGGALYGGTAQIHGSSITLTHNTAPNMGGAIYANNSGAGVDSVHIGDPGSTVTLSNNTSTFGGAVYTSGTITLDGSVITLADNNQGVSSRILNGGGGALYANEAITIGNDTSTVIISGNQAGAGGAIMVMGNNPNALALVINGASITITGNTAISSNGGAFYISGPHFILGSANSTVTVSDNIAINGSGGAIRSSDALTLGGPNNLISLTNNSAGRDGGAIQIDSGSGPSTLILQDVNGNVAGGLYSNGGAISDGGGGLTLTSQTFNDNTATVDGGGVYGYSDLAITSTQINGNRAGGRGGAIFSITGDITLSSATTTSLAGNSAGGQGGAIFAPNNVTINASGGDITFSGNQENTLATAQANALYLDNTQGAATLTLNAAGHTIAFHDPIESNTANAAVNVVVNGPGTVLFDGSQYTSASDQTSHILANTTVASGTFQVDNGAVYGAAGSTLAVQSGATLGGSGGIIGDTHVASGATVAPGGLSGPGTLTVNGNLVLDPGVILNYRFGQTNVVNGRSTT